MKVRIIIAIALILNFGMITSSQGFTEIPQQVLQKLEEYKRWQEEVHTADIAYAIIAGNTEQEIDVLRNIHKERGAQALQVKLTELLAQYEVQQKRDGRVGSFGYDRP